MFIRPVLCLFSAVLLLSTITVSAQEEAPAKEEAPKLETTLDKASYAIGYNIGKDLKRQGLELDPKTIAQGIAAALSGTKSVLSEEEVTEVFAAIREEMMKKEAEKGSRKLEKLFLKRTRKKKASKLPSRAFSIWSSKKATAPFQPKPARSALIIVAL